MNTAYVILATIGFWPVGEARMPIDAIYLPIRRSFATEAECTEHLRMRIAKHIEEFKVQGVRKDITHGTLCQTMQFSRPNLVGEDSDERYRNQELAALRGAVAGQGVLNEFVK